MINDNNKKLPFALPNKNQQNTFLQTQQNPSDFLREGGGDAVTTANATDSRFLKKITPLQPVSTIFFSFDPFWLTRG